MRPLRDVARGNRYVGARRPYTGLVPDEIFGDVRTRSFLSRREHTLMRACLSEEGTMTVRD